jgi:trk system potassium uptake protein TrkA
MVKQPLGNIMARKRSFVVIGLGGFGRTVARELMRFGNHVLGIDVSETNVTREAPHLSEAIIADARDDAALKEAGVSNYDVAVIAIGENLEASVLATMNAKMLGIETVWVKAQHKTHHRILMKIGADRVILPEQEVGQHIAQTLHNPIVRDYVSLGNGFSVVNVAVPDHMSDEPISSLKFARFREVNCLGLMRGSTFVASATPETIMKAGDSLILLGRKKELRELSDDL